MKVKRIFQFSILLLMGILSTAFVKPTPVVEVPIHETSASNFAEFLSHFKKVELPYSMNLEDFEQYENFKNGNKGKKSKKMRKKKRNSQPAIHSHFLPKTARAMFSRKGGPSNYPVARFYPNEKMIAVIYSTNDRFTGDLFHSYNLAIYNLKGDLLFPTKPNDTDNIFEDQFNLGSTSLKQTVTFSIDEKGNIWKNTYDNIWKNDTKKKGYRNNQLVDFQIKDTEVFQLNKKGIVRKLKAVPSDSRASLN